MTTHSRNPGGSRAATEPLDALWRDGARLRRLALRLGASEHDAEDAVQDAALLAMRQAAASGRTEPPRSASAWWSRVVQNLTLLQHRDRRRRRTRERTASRPEHEPSFVDAITRSERLHEFTDELQHLAEMDRALLVMRYIDERPLRSVAAELGQPTETVRKRIARARDRLRTRLQARWGREWRASCVLLGTAVGPREAAASVGVSTSTVLTMHGIKTWLIVATAGLLLLAAALLWGPPSRESGSRPSADDSTAAANSRTATVAVPDRPEPAERTELDSAPAPVDSFLDLRLGPRRFGFTGRVLDVHTHEPVPHALVHGTERVGWLETDEHGRFTWIHKTSRQRQVTFFAVADGYASAGAERGAATAPAREVTLFVERGDDVLVRVLEKGTREPMPQTVVRLQAPRGRVALAVTGTDGVARLTAVRASDAGTAPLAFRVETVYGPAWGRRFEIDAVPGADRVHDVLVERYPREAIVRVVDGETGAPIPDVRCARRIVPHRADGRSSLASLMSRRAQGQVPTEVSPDGLWRFQLPAEEPYLDIAIDAEGYHPGGLRIVAPSPSGVHEAKLRRLVRQPVHVVAGGAPLEQPATIRAELVTIDSTSYTTDRAIVPGTGPSHPFTWNRVTRTFRTDTTGRTVIDLPPYVPELIRVAIELPDGRARSFGGLLRRDLGDGTWTFDVDPKRTTIRVRVVDPTGRPVADADVVAKTWGGPGAIERGTFLSERFYELGLEDFGRTDGDGAVAIELLDLAGGDLSVAVRPAGAEERTSVRVPIAQASRDGVTVTVEPAPTARIEGRVVPRAGGYPRAGWTVRLAARPVDGGTTEYARIAPDGTFTIAGLEAGKTYRLEQRAAAGIEPLDVVAGTRGIDVEIPAIRTLDVEVVDDITGEPVHCILRALAGSPPTAHGYRPRTPGRARLGPEAADWAAVICEADGYETARVDLEPDQRHVAVRMRRKP